jgi:hypothetical protein
MKLISFLDASGNFDYERYRNAQVAGNHEKIANNWVWKPTVEFLARYIIATVGVPRFGICHGTRRGNEQCWFREMFGIGAEIIGTEISDTAVQFPHTIQHDFHERRSEWIGRADFVYSNSWDHAYDPARAISVWMESLRPDGITILEHTLAHEPQYASEMDPFGIPFDELVAFVDKIGGERFHVADVLDKFDFPIPGYYGHLKFAVVRKRVAT